MLGSGWQLGRASRPATRQRACCSSVANGSHRRSFANASRFARIGAIYSEARGKSILSVALLTASLRSVRQRTYLRHGCGGGRRSCAASTFACGPASSDQVSAPTSCSGQQMCLPLVMFEELAAGSPHMDCKLLDAWKCGAFAVGSQALSEASFGSPPFDAVRHIFDRREAAKLSPEQRAPKGDLGGKRRRPHVAWRFWRGLVSAEGEQLGPDGLDRKLTIDLTPQALASRGLTRKLGEDVERLQSFYAAQEARRNGLVPLLLASLERLFGLSPSVLAGARMHRLLDYREELPDVDSPRCQAHRDFGTFTLLWEDTAGLEVALGDDAWARAPNSGAEVVVVAGRALSLLTAGQIAAAQHRVVAPPRLDGALRTPRRSSIALFVEPAKTQRLHAPGEVNEADADALLYGSLKQCIRYQYKPAREQASSLSER